MKTYNEYIIALKDWAKATHKVMDRFEEGDVEDSNSHPVEGEKLYDN